MPQKKKTQKLRADQLLVQLNLAESRQKAQRLILAGEVFSGDQRIEKPGHPLASSTSLQVRSRSWRYVSRGGEKLEGALEDSAELMNKFLGHFETTHQVFEPTVTGDADVLVHFLEKGYGVSRPPAEYR